MKQPTARRNRFGWLAVVAALALWLAPGAGRADVKDDAKVFGKEAAAAADKSMKATEDKFHKQFVVETFASIPDDRKGEFEEKGKDKFFNEWMAARAKELNVDGVYVLVCMDPKRVQVGAGRQTTRSGLFAHENVDKLTKQLVASFKAGNYDQGLADAVVYVDQTYAAHSAAAAGDGAKPPEAAEGDGKRADHPTAPTPPPTTRPATGPVNAGPERRGVTVLTPSPGSAGRARLGVAV